MSQAKSPRAKGAGRTSRAKKDPTSEQSDRLDQAQELVYDAWEAGTAKRRIALARKALTISPLCADAYVLLAEHAAPRSWERLDYYRQGVLAGESALGGAAFTEDVGHFWGLHDTRPYMRARFGLALTLWDLGEREPALDHFRDLLRLNPNDNQGVRYLMASYLLEAGHEDELARLLEAYKDDSAAIWAYTAALLSFRRDGDTAVSRDLLAKALRRNPHVPAFLLGERTLPKQLPEYYSPGNEDEAVLYAAQNAPRWIVTQGALAWLRHVQDGGSR